MRRLNHKTILVLVNLLLTVALVATLLAPAATQVVAAPENPIGQQEILPIETIHLGAASDGSLAEQLQLTGASGQTGNGQEEMPEQEEPQQPEAAPEPDEEAEPSQPQPAPQPKPDEPVENGDGEVEETQEGEEGGETLEADLALVLTWYKYGSQAKTVVCEPNSAVGRTIQDTQLEDGRLHYQLSFSGIDSADAQIQSVRFGLLNTQGRKVAQSGHVDLEIPDGQMENSYGFTVQALWNTQDVQGNPVEQELEFQIAIYYESGLDLEMTMSWTDKTGSANALRCAADKQTSDTIRSSRLQLGALPYTMTMEGESAADAQWISAVWRDEQGGSGELTQQGTLNLTAPDSGHQDYTLTVTLEMEGKPVSFTWVLHFESTLDLELDFTWYENGTVAKTVSVDANGSVPVTIRRNQLTGDQLQYALTLTGESAANASILSAVLEGSGGATLTVPSGSVFLQAPDSGSARYTIRVTARVGGDNAETTQFVLPISYSADVSLQMTYSAMVDGAWQEFTVTCENGREKQAEVLYDNQLAEDTLQYALKLTGADGADVTIAAVSCYQSGSGRTVKLTQPTGTLQMLLAGNGKEGENAFTVTARDAAGKEYVFKINIPYKHTGQELVKISANLTEGQLVANEAELTVAITAWTEDEQGNVVEYVLQDGMTVQLDGKTYHYTGTSGHAQQYTLVPENPPTGDKNDHELYIRAEDSLGNYGEKRIRFQGERSMEGQVIGQAKIYVDMSVLGLGTRGPVTYEVLKDEPVSYVIVKALWDYEDETFGMAKDSFGWPQGSYSGTLQDGFYLRRLGDGSNLGGRANALTGNGWQSLGSTQEMVWAAIDARFGEGSNLALLWRCIYNNGIALGMVEDPYSIGEFDFTSGSGWMYSIGGSTFYPGSSMSDYYLQDGDTLTLRFTLAYGWDVGSGQRGYGDSVGYCVSCVNGSFSVHHNMQTETAPDGTTQRRCRSCGMVEGCEHAHVQWQQTEDGLCGQFCSDCGKYVQEPAEHQWDTVWREEDLEQHWLVCRNCGQEEAEAHDWKEQSSTATCETAGERISQCSLCHGSKTEQLPALGHNPEGEWRTEGDSHYQLCKTCGQEIADSRSHHQYQYDGEDWVCSVCRCYHDWECGNDQCMVVSATCQHQTLQCTVCGLTMEKTGVFEEYHRYEEGVCGYCGRQDPNYVAPLPPKPELPEPDFPEPEEPGKEEEIQDDLDGGTTR